MDTQAKEVQTLAAEMRDCLDNNILRYWTDNMVDPRGGFYGRRDADGRLHPDAPKGAILNARILWSYAAAYRLTKNPEYLAMAMRARNYILDHFIDYDHGGVYWSLDADGEPLDTKKQFYAIAFTIYGLAELHRAVGDHEALDTAVKLFRTIESHSRDRGRNGYIEATTRLWEPIADMRLSDKDDNASKTMNTHLHILEGYTALLRVWRNPKSLEATRNLLELFLSRIMAGDGHLGLFFDDDWNRQDGIHSYGHDIEASWLMLESAHVIGDDALTARVLEATGRIAKASAEGLRPDGSMVYERHGDGTIDTDRHWWVQAENVVGNVWLAKFHNQSEGMQRALDGWEYTKRNIIDAEGGEWWWARREDGSVGGDPDKAGFWKCPYHNSRMCIEVLECLGA